MLPSSGTICEFVIAEIGTLVPGGMKKKKISLSRHLCAHTPLFLRVHFPIFRYNELKYFP